MERITNHAASNQPTSHVPDGRGGILRGIVAMVLAVLGTGVLLGGFFFEVCEKVAGIPTSPLARETTVFVGACILGAGLVLAGKRAAVRLGSMMFLAGIAMYVLGFSSDEPLSVLFPFAGVFVGVIGCFIIAFGAGWLHGRYP